MAAILVHKLTKHFPVRRQWVEMARSRFRHESSKALDGVNLPEWLRQIAALLPITYAIEGMRAALLRSASRHELFHSMVPLLCFALAILPLSLLSFQFATRRARITASLSHY